MQHLVLKMIMMKSSFMKVADISAALRLYGEIWLSYPREISNSLPSSVHLENGQCVYINPNDSSRLTDMINNLPKPTLLAFLDICKTYDFTKKLHVDVPSYYVWKNNRFERRKRGINVNGWPE